MKIILSTIFSFLILTSSAQLLNIPSELKITEKSMLLEKVERNGFSVELDGEGKEILKQFGDYTESVWGVRLKTKSDEVYGEDLLVTSFSDKHFAVNAYFAQSDTGNELRFFVRFGTDIFVNSKDYPTESANVKAHLRAFAKKYYSDYVDEKLDEKKEVLAKSQKALLGIKNDISKEEKSKLKAQKSIEKLQEKNVKNEEKIRKYESDIEQNKADIVKENSEIETIEKNTSDLITKQNETQKTVDENSADVNSLLKMLTYIKNF